MKRKWLTREQVLDLRARRKAGAKQVDLAEMFGVSVQCVRYHTIKAHGDRTREKALKRYQNNREKILARLRENRRAA